MRTSSTTPAPDDGFVDCRSRHRQRHAGRRQGARVRAVLHDQGGRPRHRASGLSTVYGFVKQSHGAVSIDSAPGAGTTLDAVHPARMRSACVRRRRGVRQCDPGRLRVLLVEDDAEVAQVVRTFLAALGCTVTASQPGRAGADALGRRRRSTCC
jgi:hypothetical protein